MCWFADWVTLLSARCKYKMISETYFQQDMQCTYNVTLRRVRATIVAVEKQWVLHNLSVCICSLRYPACNAHAPYCHLCPAVKYFFFCFTFSHKRYDFLQKKKVTEHKMCVLIFSATFVWNNSHFKKNWAKYDEKCTLVFT